LPPSPVRYRTIKDRASIPLFECERRSRSFGQAGIPEIRHNPYLARSLLIPRRQGFLRSGRQEMTSISDRFEGIAFALTFLLTGVITFAALPLA
jgi:hypothetical protein